MKYLKPNEVETNFEDDFLYDYLIHLFEQIKLAQGGTSLDATLRRHVRLTNYAIAKQIECIRNIEEKFFNEDGSLKSDAISAHFSKSPSLHAH